MPLYKMFCIAAHYPEYRHIKDLVSQSATLLLEHGSTVRQIQYLGTRNLPQRMRRHKHYHAIGDYWTMHFDAPPRLLAQLSERMRTDPRVVRWTMLKLGERLEDVVAADRARTVGDADRTAALLGAARDDAREAGAFSPALQAELGLLKRGGAADAAWRRDFSAAGRKSG